MSDSESSLSTPPATDDEMPVEMPPVKATKKATPQNKKKKKKSTKADGNILSFLEKRAPSPPRKKRDPSPPHEMAFEDNFDIPFIVMFRSRFADAFPPKCPHLGPQDIEQGITQDVPSPQIESLLCALLGLVLNRKKPVEKGHYGRALEEAVQTQKSQWPASWNGINPLHGGRSFNTMTAKERLELLKTLILWALNQSEVVTAAIKEGYKSRTSKDKADTNIPLSVQPWGRDGDKRQYWLIEGQDDTAFRIYRESDRRKKNVTWWSVASSIDELRVLANKLVEEDGTRDAKALSERMLHAIPRFEATEEKRKRREYRNARKAAFTRPEPGFSLYEGRTRGKRMRYTFDDEEQDVDMDSDALSVRRSTRAYGRDTPAQPAGPTVTASGRQVRTRVTGTYGESLLSGQTIESLLGGQTIDRASPTTGDYVRSEGSEEPQQGRSSRAAATKAGDDFPKKRKHIETYNSLDEMDDEEDATSWDGGDEDEDEPSQMDVDDDSEDNASDSEEPQSLIVRLKVSKDAFNPISTTSKEDVVKPGDVVKPEHAQPQSNGIAPASAPAPAPIEPSVQPAPPVSNMVPNDIPPPNALSAVSVAPPTNAQTLPPVKAIFGAPTLPYNPQEEAKPNAEYPVAQPGAGPQYPIAKPVPNNEPAHLPFESTLPPPNSVSSWQ